MRDASSALMAHDLPSRRVVDLTPGRRAWLNALDSPTPSHSMYGLVEVDVTLPRQAIAAEKARTGENLSFTAFLISCLARAVDEHKAVQAYRKGRTQLVILDDVNVGLLIEHREGLLGHVVARANHKSWREIHGEIRAIQAAPAPKRRGIPSWFARASLLPWPVPRLVNAVIGALRRRDPTGFLAMAGTTFISAVGMFGKGHSGWAVSPTPHSLSLFAGGISTKPWVVDGRIVPRDILDLTILFDHDVVDGAPATRFVRRLIELIESGDALQLARAAS
jgi:pyruvate/2-oxoglutarate dehydrogenase complex dihydrolipoamide acyltransferase (E2) component